MKKIYYFVLFLLSNIAIGQTVVKEFSAYGNLNGSNLVCLMSDNTLWIGNGIDSWTKLDTSQLPKDVAIKIIGSKSNLNFDYSKTDLIVILEDSTIWNLEDGYSKWVKLQTNNLPTNSKIKCFRTYTKETGLSFVLDTVLVLILEDNSVWWSDGELNWEKITDVGLPNGYNIEAFNSYQKPRMYDTETRIFVTLSDSSFWWITAGEKNWKKLETKNYPTDKSIVQTEAYMKVGLGGGEGRVVSLFNDNTLMWMSARDCKWIPFETKELPIGVKIKKMNVFTKYVFSGTGTRLVVLLENNEFWTWTQESKKWSKIANEGLPITN